MSRHRHEARERLTNPDSTTIVMPEVSVLDLPYIPILWGAFNPELFMANRNRLMGLAKSFKLTHHQEETLRA